MSLATFEDFMPGETIAFGHQAVTREAILAFAAEFDPQPFHLDDAAAQRSILGGLAASGWHTACILMRMNCDEWLNRCASWGGPGIRQLKWLRPVRPGDVLSARRHLNGKRLSQSRPEMGFLDFTMELLDQNSEIVLMQEMVVMMGLAGKLAPQAKIVPRKPCAAPAASQARMSGWYEDAEPGLRTELGSYLFERQRVIDFAREYDPQPFHLSDEAAAASHFGTLSASGWHTAAAWMRRMVEARQRFDAAQAHPPESGPSPGFRDLRWLKPVYAWDCLSFSTQVVEKRATSRPSWGLVTSLNGGDNQFGERVFEFTSSVFSKMKA